MTTKLRFSGEYTESISPAERKLYLEYYLKEQEDEKNRNTSNNMPTIGKHIG